MRTRRTVFGSGGLVVVALAALVHSTAADAATPGKRCRRACRDDIAAAVAAGGDRASVRRTILAECRRDGVHVCLAPDDSSGRGRRARGSTGALVAPASVAATAQSVSAILVSWSDPNNQETAYIVERASVAGGSFVAVATVGRNVTRWTNTGLPAATTFWYRVRALGRKGAVSPYSAVASATTFGVTATTSTSSTTTTSTTTSTTTTTPVVAPTTTTTTTTRPPTTTTSTTSTTTTTRPPTTTTTTSTTSTTRPPTTTTTTSTTTTTTRASTTTTSTTTSTTTTTRPPDATAPTVPTGVAATATSCSTMAVSWNASTDAGGAGLWGYRVYRNSVLLKQVPAPATSTGDAGLVASSVYAYAVSAVDNAGNESARSTSSVANTPACPDTTAPSIPTGLTVTASACDTIGLGWNASSDGAGSGVKAYNVYRNGSFFRQVTAPATTTSDATVAATTAYGYAVSALDNAGNESARTSVVSATTPACSTVAPWLEGVVPAIGAAKDVARDPATGRLFLASIEFGLAIADVGTPSAPRAVGVANPPFYGDHVAVSGSLALVSGNSLGIRVLDVSDQSHPAVVGSLGGVFMGVALGGQYGYAIQIVPGNPARHDLLVIDLRVPSAPSIVGRLTLPEGTELTVAGSIVYVATRATGLTVVDASNPASPRVVGTANTPGSATDVAVTGGIAWVADGTGVVSVDVSNPAAPVVRGGLATSATAIFAVGTRVYALGSALLKVIDGAQPAAPVLLGTSSALGAQGVTAAGNLVYLASAEVNALTQAGGLYVLDVSVPSAPRVISNLYGGFDNMGMSSNGSLALVGGNSLGLRVVDVATPSSPRVVGSLAGTFKGTATAGSWGYAIQMVPGNPARTDVVAIDLRNPAAPAIVGRATVPDGWDLRVVGALAYVPARAYGLYVVDVSSPTALRVVGALDTPGTAAGVAVEAGWAYVADTTALLAIDVRNPAAPVQRGSLATAATAVAVSGNRAYALGGSQLKVVDVTNPGTPGLLGAGAGYGAQGIVATGTLIVLATPALNHFDAAGGVYVVDAATAASPRLLRQIVVPGTTRTIAMAGGWAFAGDSAAVVDVIGLVP